MNLNIVKEKNMKKIVLASASPRRHDILSDLGLSFQVDPAIEYEELQPDLHTPEALVEMNAVGKAREVASRNKNALVIGVDTIGLFEREILEKPKDEDDAVQMLTMIQGQAHEVLTAISIIDTESKKELTSIERTLVEFHPIAEKDIKAYVATEEPMGKAASYAIQGIAAVFVKKIDGDYLNVVGLPVQLLNKMLAEFDFHLLDAVE